MSILKPSEFADAVRDRLKQRRDELAQTLTSHYHMAKEQIDPDLNKLYRDIGTMQRQDDAKIPLSWLYTDGKLNELKQTVMENINRFAEFAKTTVENVLQWATSIGSRAAEVLMKLSQEGIVPEPAHPSIVSNLLNGARYRVAGLFSKFGRDAAQGVQTALTLGLSLGTKAKEISDSVGEVLDVPRWRSILIASTELFKVFNEVVMERYRVNGNVVTGWLWHCKLTERSCMACVALHGTLHPLHETLTDHPQGECTALPYFAGMELGQTGEEWFKGQSEDIQRAILGTEVAYRLWKAGTPLHEFIGIHHSPGYPASVYQRSAKELTKG